MIYLKGDKYKLKWEILRIYKWKPYLNLEVIYGIIILNNKGMHQRKKLILKL